MNTKIMYLSAKEIAEMERRRTARRERREKKTLRREKLQNFINSLSEGAISWLLILGIVPVYIINQLAAGPMFR